MLMRYAFVCLLAIVLGADAYAEELQDRATIQSEVQGFLQQGNFAGLEAMAGGYRATQARTSSGLWKLTLFYVGIARTVRNAGGDWAVRTARAWVAKYPQSPTAHLVYADVLPDTEKTRIYLEAHKSVAAQDPRWYEMMAEIAHEQGWSRPRFARLIDEGLDRMPAYYPIYFAAVDYFSPRWGGSAVAIDGFARQAVERTRETDGWGLYARIYWYASQSEFGDGLFTQSQVNWPDMKMGMDDVLRRYADGWNLANFLKFACLRGDGQEMKALTQRMDDSAWAVWDDQNYSATCRALSAN